MGGYAIVASAFGFKNIRKCSKWTQEEIEHGILNVIDILKLDRMPSKSETNLATGNTSLGVAITKRHGFYWWAKKLGLDIKKSETQFGNIWEEECYNTLKNKFEKVEKTWLRAPYDILINNSIKIDVKSATPTHGETGYSCHTFALNKRMPDCDIYVLYAISDENTIEKVMIIPSVFVCQVTISTGKISKYDQYIDRWDYIDSLNNSLSMLT
jgi:hypothetical protein